MSLNRFFNPKTVAVIGVSRNKDKIGRIVFDQLVKSFKGKVYPINPKAKRIGKHKCYPSVKQIPEKIDLAVIAIPANYVVDVVKECSEVGIKNVIVISSGFSEIGTEEGRRREEELKKIAEERGIRILGPNMIGILDSYTGLDTVFMNKERLPRPPKGGIAFISQSGAIGASVLEYLSSRRIGLSKFVSYGNAVDVNETDLIEYLKNDKRTKVITSYLEGIKGNGKRFIQVCKDATKSKPILVLKSGKTEKGKKAVSSHTGSLAGSAKIYSAAFKQSGIIEVESIEDLFSYAKAFVMQPLPKGNRLAIITNGGGFGVLATDECEKLGIKLPELPEKIKKKMKKVMPENAILHNPLDVLGDTTTERYKVALKEILNSNAYDGVLVIVVMQVPLLGEDVADVIVDASKKRKKPILVCSTSENLSEKLETNGVPTYSSPQKAVRAFYYLSKYAEWKASSR
ncbi:MAG: CoA-binding protein [Candidatus Aenigmarchaeota archaeon]|nr:CoA-binding protein [Candidatus Aenigmarchaeota archaeon]